MDAAADLRRLLGRIDGRGYGAWKELHGSYRVGGLDLEVEKVQSDPYAPPTRVTVHVGSGRAAFPDDLLADGVRRRALQDHLIRLLDHAIDPPLGIDAGGQQVLERTACTVSRAGDVHLRLTIELPDRRRTARGEQVVPTLLEDLPAAVDATARWQSIDREEAHRFVATVEDAAWLRRRLPELGLVAFVGDGARLPRRSGVDDRPMPEGVVDFTSPAALRVEVGLPNAGAVTGLGIPEGVTVIVGGGFHGKSTLLRAVERGVYDHVPGDGRERVVTTADAVKIRAEDGRRIERVDISAFVGELPTGEDTGDFSTADASGSTSQAASILEALEVGTGLLLLDEDTSATNLMIRDQRMQALVADDREPLTPFVDLVQPLYREHGVSTVLVSGGAGDYFDVADHVIHMDAFRPREVTAAAREVAARLPGRTRRRPSFPAPPRRIPDPASVSARRRGRIKTKAYSTDELRFGSEDIDLSGVEQLVSRAQTVGVASALVRLSEDGYLDGDATVGEAIATLMADVDAGGLDVLRGGYPGDLARPRPLEVAAALNRLRTLRISDRAPAASGP